MVGGAEALELLVLERGGQQDFGMRSRHADLIDTVLMGPFVGNIDHGSVDMTTTVLIEGRTHFGDLFLQDFEILLAASTRQAGAFAIAFQAFLTTIGRMIHIRVVLLRLKVVL